MKHSLREYEAEALRLLRSGALRREAKRDVTFPCGEATLHWAKPCFIFHAPQVRFISKQKSTALAVLFCLEVPPGIEPGIEVLQTFALPLGHGTIFC